MKSSTQGEVRGTYDYLKDRWRRGPGIDKDTFQRLGGDKLTAAAEKNRLTIRADDLRRQAPKSSEKLDPKRSAMLDRIKPADVTEKPARDAGRQRPEAPMASDRLNKEESRKKDKSPSPEKPERSPQRDSRKPESDARDSNTRAAEGRQSTPRDQRPLVSQGDQLAKDAAKFKERHAPVGEMVGTGLETAAHVGELAELFTEHLAEIVPGVGLGVETVGLFVEYFATLAAAAREKREGGQLDGMTWSMNAAETLDREGQLGNVSLPDFYKQVEKWAPPPLAEDKLGGHNLLAGRSESIRKTSADLLGAMEATKGIYREIVTGMESRDPGVRRINSDRYSALEQRYGPLGKGDAAIRNLQHQVFREIWRSVMPSLLEERERMRGR